MADPVETPPPIAPPLVRDGGKVAIRDQDGSVSMVPPEDLGLAYSEGARPASELEWQKAKMGTAGEYASAAIGAGQGLSAGFAAPIVTGAAEAIGGEQAGNDVRRALKIGKEANPEAYLTGELASAFAPIGVGAIGGAAGKATSTLGRIAEAAPHAAGLGAAFGVGEQATEDAIENKGFNASAYLSSGLKGGLMGLLLGTTTAAGLGALGDRAAALRSAAPGIEHAAIDEAEVLAPALAREPGRLTIDADAGLLGRPERAETAFSIGGKRHGVSLNDKALENEFASGVNGPGLDLFNLNPNAGVEEEELMGRRALGIGKRKDAPRDVALGDVEQGGLLPTREPIRIGQPTEAATDVELAAQGKLGAKSWLESQADKQAFKATGAKVGDIRRLAGTVEEQQAEMERIGARLRNETIEGKPLIEASTSQAEIAKRITNKADEVGKDLGKLRSELDKSKIRPSMSPIVERFESEVAQPAMAMPLGEADVAAARAYLEDMVAKGGEQPSFDTLYKYRRRLDDKLAKEYARAPGLPSAAGADAMHSLRAIVEEEFTKAGERAASDIGSEFASKYKLQKELYADLATVRKIATGEAERNAGANFVSLTDAVLAAGAGGVHGLAALAANQVRRKYGNQLASHVLGSASKLFPVQDAALKMDEALNKGAKAFVAGEKAATRTPKRVTTDEVREIRNAVRSPEAITARVETALGDLPKYAPKLSTQMATRAATIASYLRDNLPKETPPATMAFGPPKKRPLSDSDLIRAGHIIETATDPSVIVDRLNEGRLTRDHVAALKGAHPDVYAKVQTYLQQHGTELRAQLPVQKQVLLSLFFGEPITEAMLPANIRAFQASFVGGSQAPSAPPAAPPPGNPVNVGNAGNVGTASDQLERGEA